MNLNESLMIAAVFFPSILLVLFFLWNWYQDYKAWKFHKNRPRILNPWSDW